MKRCSHQWIRLAVSADGGYGWCKFCGTIGSYGKVVEPTRIPEFYQDLWPVNDLESSLLVAGRETDAMNEYRLRTGFGFKEAKTAIDRYRSSSRVQGESAKEEAGES